jgi:DNA polymerase-1
MGFDAFRKASKNAFAVQCDCAASKDVFVDDIEGEFKYSYNNYYIEGDKDNIDVLILMEYRESKYIQDLFLNIIKGFMHDKTFAIINACNCTPKNKKDDVIDPFITCKKYHVSKKIKKYNPKVIVTVGRAIYTITEEKDLNYTHFFIPVNKKHLPFQLDDCNFYSPEFKCNIFPIPPLSHYINFKEKRAKDVYEKMFVQEQIIRALANSEMPKARSEHLSYEELKDPNTYLRELIKDKARDVVVIDTESTGLHFFEDRLVSIQFSTDASSAVFCWWKDVDKNLLIELFNTDKTFVYHNAIYDNIVLMCNDVPNVRCNFDTMLATHSLNENSPNGLKPNSWLYTRFGGYENESAEYKKKYKVKDFTDIPNNLLIKYGCYDTIMTFKLYLYFKNRFELEDQDVKENYFKYIMPAIPMMVDLHLQGIPIDTQYLKEYNEKLVRKRDRIEKIIYARLGTRININSKQELSNVLKSIPNFKILEDDKGTKLLTKAGDLTLNKDTLKKYATLHNIKVCKSIVKHTHYQKEINQLGIEHYKKTGEKKGFLLSIYKNRLFCLYKLHGTGAGRASGGQDKENKETLAASKNFGVNGQNIPATDKFRKIFIPFKGNVFVHSDYSSMEVTIQAQIAGKGALEDLLLEGKDMHCYTGVSLYKLLTGKDITYEELVKKAKVHEEEEFKKLRKNAKINNFQCQYGATKWGLAKFFGVDEETGEKYLNAYFTSYPEIARYIEDMFSFVKESGFVKTLLGRKRRLPQLTYIGEDGQKNKYNSSFDVSNLKNVAANSPVQGTSGQTTFIAMTKIYQELNERNLKAKLILNVHDELMLNCPVEEIHIVKEIVERCMTTPYYKNRKGATITLQAEAEMGDLWKSTKSYSYWDDNKDKWHNLIESINYRSEISDKFLLENFKNH